MLVSQQTIEIKCFYFEMRIPPYQEVKIKGNHVKLKKFMYQNNYGIFQLHVQTYRCIAVFFK